MSDTRTALSKAGIIVRCAVARAWLAFCLLSFLFALAFLLLDGDNPLRSDDPYIVGFLFGSIGACHTLVYSAAEWLKQGKRFKHVIWLLALALWCALLCLTWWSAAEGRGIILHILMGSLIVAAVEWPLLRFGVPRTFYAITSIAGATLIGLYLYVATQVLT